MEARRRLFVQKAGKLDWENVTYRLVLIILVVTSMAMFMLCFLRNNLSFFHRKKREAIGYLDRDFFW